MFPRIPLTPKKGLLGQGIWRLGGGWLPTKPSNLPVETEHPKSVGVSWLSTTSHQSVRRRFWGLVGRAPSPKNLLEVVEDPEVLEGGQLPIELKRTLQDKISYNWG